MSQEALRSKILRNQVPANNQCPIDQWRVLSHLNKKETLIKKGRRLRASLNSTISMMNLWTKVMMKTVMSNCLSKSTNLPFQVNYLNN
jgi:hypothetical protein